MSPIYRSYAKVNLHLQVVGRREDGYHELRTLFQTVDLHDLLRVELGGEGISLQVRGADLPAGSTNLAVRAAKAYCERWLPGAGVILELDKRVPVGGGLGGGSSNAATVLLALRDQVGQPEAVEDLWPVARALGADVPYFLTGGTALGVGRGDEVLPLPELAASDLWLATPPVHVSTAEVFGALGHLTARPLASSILRLARGPGPTRLEAIEAWNDLEELVLQRYPLVRQVYTRLSAAGARLVRLSGTGATVFGWFEEPEAGAALEGILPQGSRYVRVRTLTRASVAVSWVVKPAEKA